MILVKRAVAIEDFAMLLRWRNTCSALEASRLTTDVKPSEHDKWLAARIKKHPKEPFWIMCHFQLPIGYVRLDLEDEKQRCFTVSVFVDEEFQGIKLGKQMLSLAFSDFFSKDLELEFRAVIKKNNLRSIKLFKSFGFSFSSSVDINFNEYSVSSERLRFNAINF